MPQFNTLTIAEARARSANGKRAEILAEYLGYLNLLEPGRVGSLTVQPEETTQAVRRRLGGAAAAVDLRLTIRRTADAVYFWPATEKEERRWLRRRKQGFDIFEIEDLVDAGDFKLAIRKANEALSLGITDRDVYFFRGMAYRGLEIYDRAIRDLDEAIGLGLDYEPAIYHERGRAYFETKNYEQAIRDFTKAIALALEAIPGFDDTPHINDVDRLPLAAVYYFRGRSHFETGNYEQAAEDFSESIRLEPDIGESYEARSSTYSRLGMTDEAERDFAKAADLSHQ